MTFLEREETKQAHLTGRVDSFRNLNYARNCMHGRVYFEVSVGALISII